MKFEVLSFQLLKPEELSHLVLLFVVLFVLLFVVRLLLSKQ